jgi:hypothetical protein
MKAGVSCPMAEAVDRSVQTMTTNEAEAHLACAFLRMGSMASLRNDDEWRIYNPWFETDGPAFKNDERSLTNVLKYTNG